jgi:cell division protein FtsB
MDGTILAAIALVTLLSGGALVYGQFRVSKNNSAVSGYRDTALAYESMHRAKNEEIIELRAQNAQQAAQIEALTQKTNMLQDMVTSRTLIEALARQIDGNFASLGQKIDEMLGGITRQITELAGGTRG